MKTLIYSAVGVVALYGAFCIAVNYMGSVIDAVIF